MECEESISASESPAIIANVDLKLSEQQKSIIDQVVSSEGVHFKSQQIGEPELEESEKRKIVEEVLNRSHGLFLSKFGKHLYREHLEYFKEPSETERYEVEFYLAQLRKDLKRKASKMCIKNRRFDALKKMVTEGSYFSEEEMRKRNPLLYEQLVGQYLSEDERRMREEIDTSNITIVNLLMEQIDREDLEKLKRMQQEDEDCVEEEEDTSDEEEDKSMKDTEAAPPKPSAKFSAAEKKALWGEMIDVKKEDPLGKTNWIKNTCEVSSKASSSTEISEEERSLLFEEFRNIMFENFLQGKDSDFDYRYTMLTETGDVPNISLSGTRPVWLDRKFLGKHSFFGAKKRKKNGQTNKNILLQQNKIDLNPEHDDIKTLNQDAEDKYFDSESPETNSMRNMDVDTDEDEFEKYMTQVRSEERTNQITSGIKHLNSDLAHNS